MMRKLGWGEPEEDQRDEDDVHAKACRPIMRGPDAPRHRDHSRRRPIPAVAGALRAAGHGLQIRTDDVSTDAPGTGIEAAPEKFFATPKFAAVNVFEDFLGASDAVGAIPHLLPCSPN